MASSFDIIRDISLANAMYILIAHSNKILIMEKKPIIGLIAKNLKQADLDLSLCEKHPEFKVQASTGGNFNSLYFMAITKSSCIRS